MKGNIFNDYISTKIILFISLFIIFFLPEHSFTQLNFNSGSPLKILNEYNKMSKNLAFIENKGQWDKTAKFLLSIKNMDAWVTDEGILYDFYFLRNKEPKSSFIPEEKNRKIIDNDFRQRKNPDERVGHIVNMKFINAGKKNGHRDYEKKNQELCSYNYFIGNDKTRWASNVHAFEEINAINLYDGINARYYLENGLLRYDLIVLPGADPNQIKIKFEGSDGIRINQKGELVLKTSIGDIKQGKLFAYQNTGAERKEVKCSFMKNSRGEIYFDIKDYDKSQTLIIDPLIYSSFLGGSGFEYGNAIARDGSGIYIAGTLSSSSFPFTNGGAYNTYLGGSHDMFIIKYSSDFSSQLAFTYYGGSGYDELEAIETNGTTVYIAGSTQSTDIPITVPASSFQSVLNGGYDGVVASFSTSLGTLNNATYFGGTLDDKIYDIVIDNINGKVNLCGLTYSLNFPEVNGSTYWGGPGISNGFVAYMSSSLSSISYSSHINGGDGVSVTNSIDIDELGNTYVGGVTNSTTFPRVNAFQSFLGGSNDGFIMKKNSAGTMIFSSYIGGNNTDRVDAIKYDVTTKNVYLTGQTSSSNFPANNGSYQTSLSGSSDAFISSVSSSGALYETTYFGGSSDENGLSIQIDNTGIYLAGTTSSANFPMRGALQQSNNGAGDLFFAKLSLSLIDLQFASFLGGSNQEILTRNSMILDGSGNFLSTGTTYSGDFPITTATAAQTTFGGSTDVLMLKISPQVPTYLEIKSGNNQTATINTISSPVVFVAKDASNNPVPGTILTGLLNSYPDTAWSSVSPSESSFITDNNGEISAVFQFGQKSGTYTYQGKIPGTSYTNTTSHTAVAGTPARTVIGKGDNQNGQITTTLIDSLEAIVEDVYYNRVINNNVAFTVTSKPSGSTGEAFSQPIVSTDNEGKARTRFTVGNTVGTYQITASDGVSGNDAVFNATAVPVPASFSLISGGNQFAKVMTSLTNPIVIKVLDANSQPCSNATVNLVLTNGPGGADSITLGGTLTQLTDINGLASFTFTFQRKSGTYVLTASVVGTSIPSLTINENAMQGTANKCLIYRGDQQIVERTSKCPVNLEVIVEDLYYNRCSGNSVNYSFTSSPPGAYFMAMSPSPPVSTNFSGIASISYWTGDKLGTYQVTATDLMSGKSAVFTEYAIQIPVSYTILSGNNLSATVGTNLGTPTIFIAKDKFGVGIPNLQVDLTTSSYPDTAYAMPPAIGTFTTDLNGQISTNMTLGIKAGTYKLRSQMMDYSFATYATFTAVAGPPNKCVYSKGSGQSDEREITLTDSLEVIIEDIYYNRVIGGPVTYNITSEPIGAAGSAISPALVMTDSSGKARAKFTTGDKIGDYYVTASDGVDGTTVVFKLTAKQIPIALNLVTPDNQIGKVMTAAPAARWALVDKYGGGIPGITVNLLQDSYPDTAYMTFTGGGWSSLPPSPYFGITNASGEISFSFNFNKKVGAYRSRASAAGFVSYAHYWAQAGTPAKIVYSSGDGQKAKILTTLPDSLKVIVEDSWFNRVSRIPVTFNIIETPVGATSQICNPSSMSTDTFGIATSKFTLGNKLGVYQINVSDGIDNYTVTFNLEAIQTPESIEVISGDNQIGRVTELFNNPVTVIVRDIEANPVRDIKVEGYFINQLCPDTAYPWAFAPSIDSTDANGIAELQPRFGIKVGKYSYKARVYINGGAEDTMYAFAQAGTPAKCIYVSGNNQSGRISKELSDSLVVLVEDQWYNPVSRTPVNFSFTNYPLNASGQKTNPSIALTDTFGRARSKPTLGNYLGAYTITARDSFDNSSVNFNAIANMAPSLRTDINEIDFSTANYLLDYKTLSFKVFNTSSDDTLVLSKYTIDTLGSVFEISDRFPISISPNSFYELSVKMKPVSVGNLTAGIHLINNSSNIPDLKVKLMVTINSPKISVLPDSIIYGTKSRYSLPIDTIITIKNTGYYPMKVFSIGFRNPDSTLEILNPIPSNGQFIFPTESYSLQLRMKPLWSGNKNNALIIKSNTVNYETKEIKIDLNIPETNLSFNRASIDFGTTSLENYLKTDRFIIKNIGTGPITINDLKIRNDSNSFFFIRKPVNVTLSPYMTDTIILGFFPKTAGPKSSLLQFICNEAGSNIKYFVLTGAGDGKPVISVSDKFSAGNILYGTSKDTSLLITNNGNLNLVIYDKTLTGDNKDWFTFPLAGNLLSLNNNQSRLPAMNSNFSDSVVIEHGKQEAFGIKFTGKLPPGIKTAQLFLRNNDQDRNLAKVELEGQVLAPQISKSSNLILFSDLESNNSIDSIFTLKNTGNATLKINEIYVDGPNRSEFIIPGTFIPVELQSQKDTIIHVIFSPVDTGTRYARIVIKSDDPLNQESSIVVRGSAKKIIRPRIQLSSPNVDFGESGYLETIENYLTIRNIGSDTLKVNKIITTLSDFVILENNTFIIPGNSEKIIKIKFTPQDTGIRAGVLRISSNDSANLFISANLTGRGKGSQIKTTTAVLNFGTLGFDIGAKDTAITITNNGTFKLQLTNIGFMSPVTNFELKNTLPPTGIILSPGQEYKILLSNNASALGKEENKIIINNNSENLPQLVIPVLTNILKPNLSISSKELDFGKTNLTTPSLKKALIISNTGQNAVHIKKVIEDATNSFTFEQSTTINTILPGLGDTIIISFTPTVYGTKSAQLIIMSDDSLGMIRTINLKGIAEGKSLLYASVSDIDFSNIRIKETKDTLILLENRGNLDLNITSKVISGDDKNLFTVISGGKAILLKPGKVDSIKLGITGNQPFGERTAQFVITSNDEVSPTFSINLKASINSSLLSVAPQIVNFDTVGIGIFKELTFKIYNTGNVTAKISGINLENNSDYVLEKINFPLIIDANSEKAIKVRFIPTKTGLNLNKITIESDNPYFTGMIVALSGIGKTVSIPKMSILPEALQFNDAEIKIKNEIPVVIRNNGTNNLVINSFSINGNEQSLFSVTSKSLPAVVFPGDSLNISVSLYTENVLSSLNDTLNITSNDPLYPVYSIPISGNIISSPKLTTLSILDFGYVLFGKSKEVQISIKNTGTSKLKIDSIKIDTRLKEVINIGNINLPVTLNPSEEISVIFKFTPKSNMQDDSGYVTFVCNDPISANKQMMIIGKSGKPVLTITDQVKNIDFGIKRVNVSVDTTITIKNIGDRALHVEKIFINSASKAFTVNPSNESFTISPNGSKVITIKYQSSTTLSKDSGTIEINTDDPDNPVYQIKINGETTNSALLSSLGSIEFGEITYTRFRDTTFTLTNGGGISLSINSIISLDSIQFPIISAQRSFVLSPGESKNISVRFKPVVSGEVKNVIEINSSDGSSPKIKLSVNGISLSPSIALQSTSISYSDVKVGNLKDIQIKIKNNGPGVLIPEKIVLSGNDSTEFTINQTITGKEISVGGEVQISASFYPQTAGAKKTMLKIYSNDINTPIKAISLEGNGIQQKINLSVTKVEFGQLFALNTKDTSVTLGNTGSDTLVIKKISINGKDSLKFEVLNISSYNNMILLPGKSIKLSLKYKPGAIGVMNSEIRIESNDPGVKSSIMALSGEGTVPAIILDNSLSAPEDLPMTIGYHLSENIPPLVMYIYYRKGGETKYDSMKCNYNHTFPATVITHLGMNFYIKADWGNGVISTLPKLNCTQVPLAIDIKFPEMKSDYTSIAKAYSMFTIPLQFDKNTSLLNEITRNLGPINSNEWRIFRYRNNDYEEYIDENLWQIHAGDAFWFITKEPKILDFKNSYSVPTNESYKIKLQPGWNQVGSPFIFKTDISEIIYPTGGKIERSFWEWSIEGKYIETKNYLEPWTGYFIKNNSSDTEYIYMKPVIYKAQNQVFGNLLHKSAVDKLKTGEWKYYVNVNINGRTALSEIGVMQNSRDEWDYFDASIPPKSPGEINSLYGVFDHQEWQDLKGKYIKDFRTISTIGHTWDMNIESSSIFNTTSGELILFPEGALPDNFSVIIFDYDRKLFLSSRWETKDNTRYLVYNLPLDRKQSFKKIRITIGAQELITKEQQEKKDLVREYLLLQNYPNPFNPSTRIEYTIAEPAFVMIKIYDYLGREIETLISAYQESGRYSIDWNSGNKNKYTSGIYYYRIIAGTFTDVKKMILLK